MIQSERRDKILEIVNMEKSVSVKVLSSKLGFAESTIRSDLNYLDQQKFLKRIHGGAASTEKSESFDYKKFENRLNTSSSQKIKIAKKAINYINNDDCLILDASTTCYELAKLLAASDYRLTILTNGVKTAEVLKDNPDISVVLVGGVLAKNSYAIEGDFGVDILDKFNIHKTFLSSHYINLENGMTDFNIYEVQLKQKFVEKSDKVYALIDSSKFNNKSASTICDTSCLDLLITDDELSENIKSQYTDFGLKIDNK